MAVYFGPNLILLDKLAAGGMGEVFRARQIGTGGFQKTVAVKRILPQYAARADFAEMFQREMNLCARLQHQNIVQVFSNGHEAGYLYLVMEFVNGRSVAELLIEAKRRKLRIPPEVSCFIISEVAQGLAYAHGLRDENTGMPLHIVHRDISPQNVMLGFAGEVKIVDFGIAKAADRIEKQRTGDLKGKVPYAAPEYINGNEPDCRADIFALGVVAHELLSQRPLFSAESAYDTINNVLEKPIPSLVEQFADVRFELESIVMRALERDPDERYQSAEELYRAIAVFINKAYPNFTRAEFTRFVATLFTRQEDPSIARLRDLYGYAKEVPARLVEAATNSIEISQGAVTGFMSRVMRLAFLRRAYLIPLLALLLTLTVWVALEGRAPPALEAKPSEVGNIIAWFHPGTIERKAGGRVSLWRDASWLESGAVQFNEEQQPRLQENALNGLAVVQFDGANSFLSAKGVAESLSRAASASFFYVARLRARQGVPQVVWAAQSADKGFDIMKSGFAFGTRVRLQLSGSKDVDLFDDSAALVTDEFAIYSVIVALQRGTVYQNGREVIIAPMRGKLHYDRIGVFSIGQGYVEGKEAGFFSGDLAEFIVYSRALSDAERAKIERYLSRRYKIAPAG